MKTDVAKVRICLRAFDFKTLFREHLGWDNHQAELDIPVNGNIFRFTAVAQKRGFVAFVCPSIPDRSIRLKLDHQITKSAREHIVIYVDQNAQQQIWQWVRREPGKPLASRDHRFESSQSGDRLIQRLDQISVSLDEEEKITVLDVTGSARSAFDVDKVTKRFYDHFKAEQSAFLKFIKGIKSDADLQWYTSLMLNRLMFVYFIQKKGFLDGDTNYLRNRQAMVLQNKGKDKFQSFYRYFLLRLFHDGLGKAPEERKLDGQLEKLLGKVPFLNGGFFEVHKLEELNPTIDIPDRAFERLFDFFDQYSWHLDERPLRADNEINPDVVGYIFEKYINQKQMGAYYTKEDITEYISKNTIVPFLFDTAQKKCAGAFKSDGELWQLIRGDPDRYIYPAMRQGVLGEKGDVIPLPKEIEAGVEDVGKRDGWNRPAGAPYALSTETWREHVARRQRCLEVREKLCKGEVHAINDLITLNLDIWQFLRDVLAHAENPELLRAFWHAIEKVTILDPTCGSGAFLFSALRILETLYSDCLNRMEWLTENFVDNKHHNEQLDDFRGLVSKIAEHPNEHYFILKSIIINNLFGVDIMEEAVEICKLRLFLKLIAQVERADQIEPLPDIDFNIRAGNTLVGYASLEQVRRSQEGTLGFGQDQIRGIEEDAEIVEAAFDQFRAQQTNLGGRATRKDKQALRGRLTKLDIKLDRFLAGEYGINIGKQKNFDAWKSTHEPFHWFVEFYGIMNSGGFDIIIGNPPYVEISDVRDKYSIFGLNLIETGNLFSVCVERCLGLLRHNGRIGVIVPISSISTPRMMPLMKILEDSLESLHVSNFAVRPGKLFVGVDMNLTVILGESAIGDKGLGKIFSTAYNRWQEDYRRYLFDTLEYFSTGIRDDMNSIPKIGSEKSASILSKLSNFPRLDSFLGIESQGDKVYYHSGGRYFRKCIREKLSNEYKELTVRPGFGDAVICLLSSGLYYWFWIVTSDCYHVTKRDVNSMYFAPTLIDDGRLKILAKKLLKDLEKNSRTTLRSRADGSQQNEVSFRVGLSKDILDEIDFVLASHYGFDDIQLDFLLNNDSKYRGGSEDEE